MMGDMRNHVPAPNAIQNGIWWPVDSPYKGEVTRKIFPYDDVIMYVIHFAIALRYAISCNDNHKIRL